MTGMRGRRASETLVVVSGLPAAGKSSLARRLARDLGIVSLTRDQLKVPIWDLAPFLPESEQWRIGRANRLVFERALAAVLESGLPVVADGNFNWPHDREGLRSLVAERRLVTFEICLWADGEVLRRRFGERADPPLDDGLRPLFEEAVSRPREPVTTGERVELDTTEFSALEEAYPGLVDRLRSFLGAAHQPPE